MSTLTLQRTESTMSDTTELTMHSRTALARVWLTTKSGAELKVDGRSIDPLLRRGLIERRKPGRGHRGLASDYDLTAEGLEACSAPQLVREISTQGRLERDRAYQAAEKAQRQVEIQGTKVRAMGRALGILEAAR